MADKDGNKTGGREKGTKNKVSLETKEFYAGLVADNHEKIERELKSLTGKQFLDAISAINPYHIPKLQSVSAVINAEVKQKTVTIVKNYKNSKDE